MQVLHSCSALSRLLHDALYKRLIAFAKEYTPELPAEPIVELWLRAFYDSQSKNVHILVNLDDEYNIRAHCVILIGEEYGYKVCYLHQLRDDAKSSVFLDECVEYFKKLVEETHSYCGVFSAVKGLKALEKKYGFKATRTLMHYRPLCQTEDVQSG